jgi:hypothetical protein
MPSSIPNPYRASSPIGQAIGNLGAAIFSGPSPIEQQRMQAENELISAKTAKARADARQIEGARQAQSGIAGLFNQVNDQGRNKLAPVQDPGVAGPARAVAATAAEDVRDNAHQFFDDLPASYAAASAPLVNSTKDAGDIFRFLVANNSNFDDDAIIRAQAGQGGTIGVNDAVSLSGQDRVRAGNIAGDIAKENAKPITETQARGAAFGLLPADAQATAVGPTLTEVQGSFAAPNVGRIDDLSPAQQAFISAQPSASGSGGLTVAQQSSNAEIDQARAALATRRLTAGDVRRLTQSSTNTGRVNEDYEPGLAAVVRAATSRKAGDDPDYAGYFNRYLGGSAAEPTLDDLAGIAPAQDPAAQGSGASPDIGVRRPAGRGVSQPGPLSAPPASRFDGMDADQLGSIVDGPEATNLSADDLAAIERRLSVLGF